MSYVFIVFALVVGQLPSETAGPTTRVLLVGDSWSNFLWTNRSLRDMFANHGRSDVIEKGDVTAISGSTAQEWATASNLQLITDELNANPSIEVVVLTMGGNDFLAGQPGGGWYAGMTQGEFDFLADRVIVDIEVVIQHVQALRPQAEILISLYDYTNFVESLGGLLGFLCNGTFDDLNHPSAFEINTAQTAFEDLLVAALVDDVKVFQVGHSGSMQFHVGYPSMGILPGELVPPGNLALPSPPEAMLFGYDCFHLNAQGYDVLAENMWSGFFAARYGCISDPLTLLGQWPGSQTVLDLVWAVNTPCVTRALDAGIDW